MTGRTTRPKGNAASQGGRLGAPSTPESAREIFGRFVRTLEKLDAARGSAASAAKVQKAETSQNWEVTGCGRR